MNLDYTELLVPVTHIRAIKVLRDEDSSRLDDDWEEETSKGIYLVDNFHYHPLLSGARIAYRPNAQEWQQPRAR